MADNPNPDPIIQDLLVRITTLLEGHQNAIRNMSSIRRDIDSTRRQIDLLRTSSTILFKTFNMIGSILRTTIKTSFSTAATAAGALYKSTIQTGTAFQNLELTSINAGRSMSVLQKHYDSLKSKNKELISSLQGLSGIVAQFQDTMARRTMDNAPKGLMIISEALARGQKNAEESNKSILNLMDSVRDYRDVGQEILDIFSAIPADFNASDIKNVMDGLEKQTGMIGDTEPLGNVLQRLKLLYDELNGSIENKSVASVRKLNDAINRLRTVIEGVQNTISETFGPYIAEKLNQLSQWIGQEIPKAIQIAIDKFEEFGGVPKVLEYIKIGWEKIKSVLSSVIERIKPIYDFFKSLPNWAQIGFGGAAAAALLFRKEIIALIALCVKKNFACMGGGAGGTGGTGGAGGAGGAGGRFKTPIPGFLRMGLSVAAGEGGRRLGNMGVQAMGAEKGGNIDAAGGILGAAAAGGAIGGPWGATAAATVAALSELAGAINSVRESSKDLTSQINQNSLSANKYAEMLQQEGNIAATELDQIQLKRKKLASEIMSLGDQEVRSRGWFGGSTEKSEAIAQQIARKRSEMQELADAETNERNKIGEDATYKKAEAEKKYAKILEEINKLQDQNNESSKEQLEKLKKKAKQAAIDTGDAEKIKLLNKRAEAEKESATQTKKSTSAIEILNTILNDMSQNRLWIDSLGSSISALKESTATFGTAAPIGGKTAEERLKKQAQQSFDQAKGLYKKISDLQKALDSSNIPEDTRIEMEKKLAEAQDSYTKAQKQGQDALVATQQAELERVTRIKDVISEEMRMSEAMYGTASLAVEKRLEMVKALDAERQLLQEQMNIYANLRDQALEEASITKDKDEQGRLMGIAYSHEQKRLEAAKQVRSVQAQQLEQVKELRDGYLDAVKAQAFGAGRFQKILIDQEQHLGQGLEKRMIKENFLIGQIGEAAAQSNKQATMFSSGGTGIMQDLHGNVMDRKAVAKENQELIKNIADPLARSMAEESQKMLGGVFSGFEQTTSLSVESHNKNTQAVDRLTSAITQKYMPTGVTGALASGGPAAQVAIGETARTAAGPGRKGVPGLIAVDYRPQKEDEESKELKRLKRVRDRALGDLVGHISGTASDIHGFDSRSAKEISADRNRNKKEIEKLEKNFIKADERYNRQLYNEGKMSPIEAGGRTGKNVRLGKVNSSSNSFETTFKSIGNVLIKVGESIDSFMNQENNTEKLRSNTRTGSSL